MKKVLFLAVIASVFLVSCGKKSQERTSTDQYMDQQMDRIQDQKQAIKNEYRLRMERKKLQDLWETYSDCDETPKKKTEKICDGECGGTCGRCIIINNNINWPTAPAPAPKTPKAPRVPKVSKPICPTCPTVTPAPEKVREETKTETVEVEKVVENRKDECLTCETNSFLLFQYGKAFCVLKSSGDVFKYNGELSAADERQLETSKTLKMGLCIHKTGVREYKICNLDGSAFTGEPWK